MAQDELKGTLPGWDQGKADIIKMAGGDKYLVIGTIDESGKLTIPLKDDLFKRTKKAMEEKNSSSPPRFQL